MPPWLWWSWCVCAWAADPIFDVGLLEIGNTSSRQQIVQAFLLAIDDTNFDSYDNNQGTKFQLRGVVSLVPDDANATKALLDQGTTLTADSNLIALVGSWTESFTMDSQVISKGAQKPYVGYKAESALLAEQERFPFFLRVNPSEVQQCIALAQFIYAMQWQRVGVVEGVSSTTADIFMKVARARGLEVVHKATIATYNDPNATSAALLEVQDKGATIIVLAVDPTELQTTLNAAFSLGFLNSFYEFLALGESSSWGLELLPATARLRYQGLIGLRWKTDLRFGTFSSELNNRIAQQRVPCTTNGACISRNCGPEGYCLGFGTEGANLYAGFVADAVALLSACVKKVIDSNGNPLDGPGLVAACKGIQTPILGYTATQFQLDQSGSRWMNVSVINVQGDTMVPVATWTPGTAASEKDWTGDQCSSNDLPTNLGSLELLCATPDAKCSIQWPKPSLGRPTGASTYVSLGILMPSVTDALFDDWLSAMYEATEEINNSSLVLSQGGKVPALRLRVVSYENFGDLLRAAGELVKEPLIVAVFGPAYRSDEPLITVNSVSQITTAAAIPQLDYSSSGSFFLPTTNREEYPLYVSLAPSDLLAARATAAILNNYQWWNVTLITAAQDVNRPAVFGSVIANSPVTVMAAVQIGKNETRASLAAKMTALKATGARTVICWLDDPDTFRSVFDAGEKAKLTSSQNITWIIPSFDVTESIWMNKELRSPYSPRMLVEMESLLCLYLPAPSPGVASDPRPTVNVSSSFDSANSMSARVKFVRDAVYLLAMAMSTVLKGFKDPLAGSNLVAGMRNHSYSYAVTFTGKAQRGEKDFAGTKYRTSILIDAQGDRILPLVIKNMDTEGQLNDVGTFDVTASPALSFFSDVVFVGGRTEPPKSVLCDYEWFYDQQSRSCKHCPVPSYAFDEKLWRCGELRPEELSFRSSSIALAFFAAGLLAFAFLLCVGYWRYDKYQEGRVVSGDWHKNASNDLAWGFRLDILMTGCAIFAEVFDLVTNWILAFYFIEVRIEAFLWMTLFYFLFLAINTILSFVYMYHLCMALQELVEDLSKGVKSMDDMKLASLTESRMAGDRRKSVWGDNPMIAKLRTEHFMNTAKIVLALAFLEDAVTVIFGAIYLKTLELQAPMICIVSIAWSLFAFGQKIGAWKDLMYLTEKRAWLITTENTQPRSPLRRAAGNRASQFGKGISGPIDTRPELRILADIRREQELKKNGGIPTGPHSPLLSGVDRHSSQTASKLPRRQGSFSGSAPATRSRRGMDNPLPPNFSSPHHGVDDTDIKTSPYGLDEHFDDQNMDFGEEEPNHEYGVHMREESRYDDQEHFGDAQSQPDNPDLEEDEELIPEVEDMHAEFADENQGIVYGGHTETPPRAATAYDNQVYDGYDNNLDVFRSPERTELRRR